MIEFHDNFFDCPYGNASSPACTPYSGKFVMDQLGIPRDYVATGCLALMGFVLFYVITSWLFLRLLPVKISLSKRVQSSEKEQGTAEAAASAKAAEQRPAEVTIRVQGLKLWIDKRGLFKRSEVHILQGITVHFEPGKLNIIMGPSGRTL
jgi:hypothetical protein